jgi:hypothetical protein
MICEIQLAASDFLTTIKNKAANSGTCLASAALPFPGTDAAYLDHLELGNAIFLSAARAAVDFTVVIVSQTTLELIGAGPLPPALTVRVTGTVWLDLSIDTTTPGGPYFKTDYAGVHNVANPEEAAALDAAFRAATSFTQMVPLDTSKIAKAIGKAGATPMIGVAREVTGAALAIRLDFAFGPSSIGPWMTFHQGFFPVRINPASGENFAIFLDVEAATNPITQSLLDHAFTGKTHLDSGLIPVWSPAAGGADVHYDFTIRAEDACSLGPFSNDIRADVTLDISYRMPAATTLVTTGNLDWDVNDWDVIVCALKTFGIGVILGAFGANLFNPAGEALGAEILGMVGFFAPIVVASVYTPDLSSSFKNKPSCTQSADQKSFTCTIDLPVPRIIGPTNLTRLEGTPDGLTVVGHTRLSLVALPIIDSIQTKPFTYGVHGSCSKGFSIQDQASVAVNFVSQTSGATMGAVTLCNYSILDVAAADSYTITPSLVGETTELIIQTVGEPSVDCRVLFLSNGGARILNFGIPPELTPEQSRTLNIIAGAERVNCTQLVTGWHGIVGLFDPHWLVDPGDLVANPQAHQIWQYAVTQLGAGSVITLHTQDGGQIGEAVAGRNGAIELSAVTPFQARPAGTVSLPGLQLRRAGSNDQPGAVFHRQTLLRKQSEIALAGPAERLGMTLIGSRTAVVVQFAGGEQVVYSLGAPAFPTFLGAEGLIRTSGFAGPNQSATVGNRVFTIAAGRVDIRRTSGNRVGHIDAHDPSAVFALSHGVVIRDAQGLNVFSLDEDDDDDSPELVRTIPLALDIQVCPPLGVAVRNALFIGTNGGGQVLNFADLDCPETVARYSATPWFVGMDRRGNTAARLVPGKPDVLEIFDASLTSYFQLSAPEER